MNNKENIINLIKTYEVLTKPQISKLTKLSLPTINKYVNDLIDEKILEVDSTSRRRTEGKPPTYYRLNRNYGKLLGIFFHRNSIIFLVTNIIGNIEKKTQKRMILFWIVLQKLLDKKVLFVQRKSLLRVSKFAKVTQLAFW